MTRYIDWTAPDGGLVVRIAESVVTRINIEVMRGYGVTRRRGAEVGGILIGNSRKGSPTVITIDDFEQVSCEYAYGPSYLLSANDEALFSQAVNRWRHGPGRDTWAVGFYRSHTRDGLAPDAPDSELYARYLNVDPGVALLIKPFATRAPVASYFVPSKGRLKPDAPAVEFPFTPPTPHEAEPASPVAVAAPAAHPAEPQPVSVAPAIAAVADPDLDIESSSPPSTPPRRASMDRALVDVLGPRDDLPADPERDYYGRPLFAQYAPPQTPRWKTRLAWFAFTVAVFACGTVLGYQYAGGHTGQWLAFTEAIPVRDPYALSLSARLRGDSVVVQWNRFAQSVGTARSGLLLVNETGTVKEIRLSQPELRSGVVLYRTPAIEARFRLELDLGNGRAVAETTNWRRGVPIQ